jgi:pseudaminic acid synthase
VLSEGRTEAVPSMKRVNFVAELSANHNKSLERAHTIIDQLADSGATSIKLQTYKPETMTLNLSDERFKVPLANPLWGGKSLFELYGDAMTPWEWHEELFAHANERGLTAFSSPFDQSAIDFLESLECPIYKIASFEIVDLELIRYAAATGKPLIISTGMATLQEVSQAVEAAKNAGCADLTLLKTTSSYPANPRHSNLSTMSAMREAFGLPIGISDHTLGIGVAIAAVTLGATVVEKHVTLRRSDGGVDGSFSMEPDEFKMLVEESTKAASAVGTVNFGPSDGDRDSLAFRRSLLVTRDVNKGEAVSRENVRGLRPGGGLPISYFPLIEGLVFARDYVAGEPVRLEMFKDLTD